MPRAPTPARSPPPRPLRGGDVAFRPTQDVGPRDQCISGLHHAAYALPVNASRPFEAFFIGFSKKRATLADVKAMVAMFFVWYNVCRVHDDAPSSRGDLAAGGV